MPAIRFDRPRPAPLNVMPVMLSVEVPVSLNTSFSVSPFNRLTPLNEESCAVVLICCSMLLYCATRPARVACAAGSCDRSRREPWPLNERAVAADRADLLRGVIVGVRMSVARLDRSWLAGCWPPAPFQLVEVADLPGSGAEGDVGRRAGAGGGDRERPARERRRRRGLVVRWPGRKRRARWCCRAMTRGLRSCPC